MSNLYKVTVKQIKTRNYLFGTWEAFVIKNNRKSTRIQLPNFNNNGHYEYRINQIQNKLKDFGINSVDNNDIVIK